MEFERAALLRDQVYEIREIMAEEANLSPWQRAKMLAGEEDNTDAMPYKPGMGV